MHASCGFHTVALQYRASGPAAGRTRRCRAAPGSRPRSASQRSVRSVAKAMPSRSCVGICIATVSEGRSLHQPRDHRKQLDDEADVSGLEIVERRLDAVIGIVADGGDIALRQQAPRHRSDVFPFWMPAVRPRRSAVDGDIGREPPVDRDALVEHEIGLRKSHDGRALRRDRRARDHRIAGALREAREDAVEILARVRDRPQARARAGSHTACISSMSKPVATPSFMMSNGGSGYADRMTSVPAVSVRITLLLPGVRPARDCRARLDRWRN